MTDVPRTTCLSFNRLAKWERLSRSTDHDDAGDTWQQQLGSSLPDPRVTGVGR
jgi:hypothetical protein